MKMTNQELQKALDLKKWHASEQNGEDMCKKMPYCGYCKIEEEFPCAKAYNRMVKAEKAAAKAEPEKAVVATTAVAKEPQKAKGCCRKKCDAKK